MGSDSETPSRGRPRSQPPKPFTLGANSVVAMNLGTIVGLSLALISATAIYFKMPSAAQIDKIEADMQEQITANKTHIDRMSTQVDFLVRIEVNKAHSDPTHKQVVRKAAREARSAAVADAQQPPQPASPDPLDGIRLE